MPNIFSDYQRNTATLEPPKGSNIFADYYKDEKPKPSGALSQIADQWLTPEPQPIQPLQAAAVAPNIQTSGLPAQRQPFGYQPSTLIAPPPEEQQFVQEYEQDKAANLTKRFGKQIANSFARIGESIISSPLSPIGVSQEKSRPYRQQAMKELDASGFKGSAAQAEQMIRTRADQLAASDLVPKFQVKPAETVSEKATDVAAGLTSFMTQLALTRKILPKGTSEPLVWEVQNQLGGGIPGQGFVTRTALGGIAKIPTSTIAGKAAKVGLESSLFAGITGLTGGKAEDMIVSALVPIAFNGWNFAKQRSYLTEYEGNLRNQAQANFNKRAREGMPEPFNRMHYLVDIRAIDNAVSKAKQKIYHDDAFAPAKEKWETERQLALKMVKSGKPDQVARGNAILDFMGRTTPTSRQEIKIPTTRTGEVIEAVKEKIKGAPKETKPVSAAELGLKPETPVKIPETAPPKEVTPPPAQPAQAQPLEQRKTLAQQAQDAQTQDLERLQENLNNKKKANNGKLNKDDTARLKTVKKELTERNRKDVKWAEMSDEEWLAQTRFYRSGKTKNAELPDGRRVILKKESTESNFREISKDFLLSVKPKPIETSAKSAEEKPKEAPKPVRREESNIGALPGMGEEVKETTRKEIEKRFPEFEAIETSELSDRLVRDWPGIRDKFDKIAAEMRQLGEKPVGVILDREEGKKADRIDELETQVDELSQRILDNLQEAKPTPFEAGPKVEKPTPEKVRVMGMDATMVKKQTIDGVDYELYKAWAAYDSDGFVRIIDADTKEVVTLKHYRKFSEAETGYKDTIEKVAKKPEPKPIEKAGIVSKYEPLSKGQLRRVKQIDDAIKKLNQGRPVAEDMAINDRGASLKRLDNKISKLQEERNAIFAKRKPTEEKEPIHEQPKESLKAEKSLIKKVYETLNTGATLDAKKFFEMADEAYGGTRAQGKYGPSDAYDALEVGINKLLQDLTNPADNLEGTGVDLNVIEGHLNQIPSQTNRSGEKDLMQQFSTPPNYAYAVAWAANIGPEDIVLEPSAGTGSIVVQAVNAGPKKVIANELSQRRAELLKQLKGIDKIYTEDAEQIQNILPEDERPSVVLMNPPFSHAAGRMGAKKVYGTDLKHIDAALQYLQDNGRLVAIMGRPRVEGESETFRKWIEQKQKNYNVRANVFVGRKVYKKYGTQFPTRILIIDKTGPQSGEILGGTVDTIPDLMYHIQGVRDERIAAQPKAARKALQEAPGIAEGTARPEKPVQPAITGLGTEQQRPVRPVERRPAETNRPGEPNVRVGQEKGTAGITGERPAGGRPATIGNVPGGERPREVRGRKEPGTKPETVSVKGEQANRIKEHTAVEAVFEPYQPSKFSLKEAKKHPASIVESTAMAAVEPPDLKYELAIPIDVIKLGQLSDIQLENISYAGQAHEVILPNGQRKGYFIGDGTGVGKGREVAGVILDNWNKGRKKAIWFSASKKLLVDAKRDWKGIGRDPSKIFDLGSVKGDANVEAKSGILFSTYHTLISSAKGKGGGKPKRRIDQIIKWLGEDFDGVIVFDESHKMANALNQRGTRGIKKASATALTGIELQNRLPNARILYVSATGATEVSNLAYAMRLGLWGPDTPFPTPDSFIAEMLSGGIANMELVARDLKALGLYAARQLSFNDGTERGTVLFDRITHNLSTEQIEIYDKLCEGWQVTLQNFNAALEATSANLNSDAKKVAKSIYWGAQQRFFNQILTAMQTPTVIKSIEKDLKDGKSAVIQLTNTNEADQERALSRLSKDESLDDFDTTPREMLMQLVDHSFPVNQYEEYQDENGNIRSRLVEDSHGNPVINREAQRMKDNLLDQIGSIRVPESPLDMIINHFGFKNVGEVTGRKRRVINKEQPDGSIKRIIDKRGKRTNQAEIDAFMNGKKRILIFSEAGGIGASYHADNDSKNKQQRVHYLLQPGWRADVAIQGLGRTHRSNEAWAPIYKLITTNLKGQMRFISSIARRLSQLGALTRGERKAGESGLFSASDNLESQEAHDALRMFFRDLISGEMPFTEAEFSKQTGLELRDKNGNPKKDLPPIHQFLNRLLSLKVDLQNQVFDAFQERLDAKVEQAIADGTLDQGMERYKADHVEKVKEQLVYTHPETNSQTKYVQLKAYRRNNPISWEDIKSREPLKYIKSSKGNIYAVTPARAKTEGTTGRIVDQYRLTPPNGTSHFAEQYRIDYYGNYEKIDIKEAQRLWEQQYNEVPEFNSKTEHFLTGLILPIWDKIRGTAKIYRIVTTEGEEMIGRTITPNALQNTLKALGALDNAKITPEKAAIELLEGNIEAELSNQWKLKRSQVQGESRIELIGPSFRYEDELQTHGIFKERIQYSTRYFVPKEKVESVIRRWPIVEVTYLDKGFTADPSEEGPAMGEPGFAGVAGRPGGKVPKPWLTMEKAQSPDKDIEDFFGRTKRPPYSKKASSLLEKIEIGLRERFEFAWHIPKTKENAIFVDMIRTMPEERRHAYEQGVRDIVAVLDGDGTVQALDSAGLDTLRRKVFIQDLVYEAKIDRSVSGKLTLEQLEAEDARLDKLIDKVPSVKKAYEARQNLWQTVSDDLLERGVLDEESAKNQAYVRHFVLDLAEKNRPTGFLRKRLSAPYRGYSKHRKGSKRDISTDYLAVEVRALGDIYADNAVEDAANEICRLSEEKFGGRKKYTAMAKAENFENLVGGPENVERIEWLRNAIRASREGPNSQESDEKAQRADWIEELTKLDPTYPYRKRIAMHMSKFKKNYIYIDFDFIEDSELFKELAKAAKEQAKEPEGLAARGVFKAMAEREKMIRTALGRQYVTPEKVAARDGMVEYFYKRPNLFYRATTITESQIAAFVENNAEETASILNISLDRVHQALVLGRRKGWIIPDWLAAQLDDLPVNKRSNYIVRSFTKPFIQFIKRWYLRMNPFRYNSRNALGDTERFAVAGQEGAIPFIPGALKELILKESEEYKLAKRHGVVNSTLWHEMNDVSRIKDFERFKNISRTKTFRIAVRKALALPIKTASHVGSIEQNLTQMREDILRMASFQYNYRRLQQGKSIKHWAGKVAEINEIAKTDKARAAAKVSRETLGDYGQFTPFENDVLRQGMIPFYSWMKINTKFWVHVPIEAAKEGMFGKSLAAAVPMAGFNIAKWLIRALWIYGALYLWNHRDEEAQNKEASLPFWLRAMPHANIGDYTLWGQTALSDFVEWGDMERLSGVFWRMDAGFLSREQAAKEACRIIAEAPVNKVYQALNPFMKAPITAITGQETYPSVFEPYFVASPASRRSLERAMLDIMGGDAKKFYQSATGNRKFEDTLYAYFAGWFARPMDVDTFINELERTKEYVAIKRKYKGRLPGSPKKGREAEWQEMKIREKALNKRQENQ